MQQKQRHGRQAATEEEFRLEFEAVAYMIHAVHISNCTKYESVQGGKYGCKSIVQSARMHDDALTFRTTREIKGRPAPRD